MIELPRVIANNIDQFSGRVWLLPKVLEWFDDNKERVLVLSGEPGSGKSMIAAWLAGMGPAPVDPRPRQQLDRIRSLIYAAHFCQTTHTNTDPRAVAESLARQLTTRIPQFGKALADSLADRVQIIASVGANAINSGANVSGLRIDYLDLRG